MTISGEDLVASDVIAVRFGRYINSNNTLRFVCVFQSSICFLPYLTTFIMRGMHVFLLLKGGRCRLLGATSFNILHSSVDCV